MVCSPVAAKLRITLLRMGASVAGVTREAPAPPDVATRHGAVQGQ